MKKLIHLTVPVLVLLAGLHPAAAQGTKFTYQGHFNDSGAPANGSYDLEFSLFKVSVGDSPVAGPITNSPVAVSNGLFTTSIDFGAGEFNGTAYWLQIAVRTNGGGAFTELAPRQELTPTPYAIYAGGADAAGLNGIIPAANLGTISDAQLSPNVALLNASQTFTGVNNFSGDISLLDATKSITFPPTGGANAPMMQMFASGTQNADRMVIAHSPSFSTWGLQYQDVSDRFNFLRGGTPVMTIDLGSPRVSIATQLGIGNATPGYPLDVVASQAVGRFSTTNSVNGSVLVLDNSSAAINYYGAINFQGGNGQIGYITNDIMTFRTAGAERLRIGNSGNVGIGNPTPSYRLDIDGGGNSSVLRLAGDNNPLMTFFEGATYRAFLQAFNDDFYLANRSAGKLLFRTTNLDRMAIDAVGNVGIGTTAPDAESRLHLLLPNSVSIPNFQIQSLLGDNGFGIKFTNPDANWFVGPNIGNWPDDRFTILADSSNSGLIIAANGNVGIDSVSSATPFAKLTVNGTIGFPTVSTPAMYVYPSGTSNPEKRLIVHSPDFPEYGLYYADLGDQFVMKSAAADTAPSLVVDLDGNWVAIATTTPKPGYELSVNGQIVCEELLVEDSANWPDYVFKDDYALRPLADVEAHIKEKRHLPGIPTAADVKRDGLPIGEMQKRMMEKIEELTLYVIDQNKRLVAQEKRIEQLQSQLRDREAKP